MPTQIVMDYTGDTPCLRPRGSSGSRETVHGVDRRRLCRGGAHRAGAGDTLGLSQKSTVSSGVTMTGNATRQRWTASPSQIGAAAFDTNSILTKRA
jgi:hypothetical protein